MDINKAKELLSKTPKEKIKVSKHPGIGWEIGAYITRAVSVAAPSAVIMTLENSWLKNGLGLFATLTIIALLIIFKEPIKRASSYAPGVIPFAIFVVIAIFFDTTAKTLLTVGISGLTGSIAATPMHMKYLSYVEQAKSPELVALESIAQSLK